MMWRFEEHDLSTTRDAASGLFVRHLGSGLLG